LSIGVYSRYAVSEALSWSMTGPTVGFAVTAVGHLTVRRQKTDSLVHVSIVY